VPNQATVSWVDSGGKSQTSASNTPTDDMQDENCVPPPSDSSNPDPKGVSIAKAADPVDCTPAGTAFLCTYTITVINNDPVNPQTNVKIVDSDTYVHNTGLTVNTGSPSTPGWTCTSGSQDATCEIASIAPGQSATLQVTIDTNAHFDLSSASCTVSNAAWIDGEQAATEVSVGANLPDGTAGCMTPPTNPTTSVVSFTKDGDGTCTHDSANGVYVCGYTATFANADPSSAYMGDLLFSDPVAAPATAIEEDKAASDGRWDCSTSTATAVYCTIAPTPGTPTIPLGGKVTVHVTTTVPVGAVTDATSCTVTNTAAGATLSAGGNTKSGDDTLPTDPGDNSNCQPATTPPPPMSGTLLNVEKTGGQICTPDQAGTYVCTYGVDVTILQAFTGPIFVDDNVSILPNVTVTPTSGCTLVGSPGAVITCEIPSATYKAGDVASASLSVSVPTTSPRT
jgi:hypothetical protein